MYHLYIHSSIGICDYSSNIKIVDQLYAMWFIFIALEILLRKTKRKSLFLGKYYATKHLPNEGACLVFPLVGSLAAQPLNDLVTQLARSMAGHLPGCGFESLPESLSFFSLLHVFIFHLFNNGFDKVKV